jgi:hypothetical protein
MCLAVLPAYWVVVGNSATTAVLTNCKAPWAGKYGGKQSLLRQPGHILPHDPVVRTRVVKYDDRAWTQFRPQMFEFANSQR